MLKNFNILSDNPSCSGKLLFRCDKIMHNIKFYIKRHNISIEILFLMIYTGLNLALIFFIKERSISIFIVFRIGKVSYTFKIYYR